MWGAAGVAGEDAAARPHDLLPDPNNGGKVISLSPILLVFYVWLLQMVILFVSLQNVRNILGWNKNSAES
jgi:hypothetical protein